MILLFTNEMLFDAIIEILESLMYGFYDFAFAMAEEWGWILFPALAAFGIFYCAKVGKRFYNRFAK